MRKIANWAFLVFILICLYGIVRKSWDDIPLSWGDKMLLTSSIIGAAFHWIKDTVEDRAWL